MAISTLAELKTEIINYTKRADLASYLDNIILEGEKWIFRRARTRDMETSMSDATVGGAVIVPADFVELKNARVDGQPRPLTIASADIIYHRYPLRSGGQMPVLIGVEAGNFIFGPFASDGLLIVGTYYARPDSILDSPPESAFFLEHPDLYLYAALACTAQFLKDDGRIAGWISMRDATLRDINDESERSHYGDGLAVTPM